MNTELLNPETDTEATDEFDELLEESFDPPNETSEPTPENEAASALAAEPPVPPVPAAQDHKINGLINELRHTREELKALRAQQQAHAHSEPVRDFAAEKARLHKQWEDGELDSDAYQDQRETLILQQAQQLAAAQFQQLQQQQQQQVHAQAWEQVIGPWQAKHADFLANPIRRNVVNDLITRLDADPNNRLSDQELLEKVETAAFEAFNWQPKAAPAAVSPRALANARALAAASATPPPPVRGAGSALSAGTINLETLRPGQFSKLPPHLQKELLDDED